MEGQLIADTTPLPVIPEDGDKEDTFMSTSQEIMDQLKVIRHKADDMANALRLRKSNLPSPFKMKDVVDCWLNQNYNIAKWGQPCWSSLIAAVADDNGGANKALANRLAEIYRPGTHSVSTRQPPNPPKKPEQETFLPERSFSTTSTGSITSTGSSVSGPLLTSTGSSTLGLPPLTPQISYPISESGEESSVQPNSSVPSSNKETFPSSISTQTSGEVVSHQPSEEEEIDEVVFDQTSKPGEHNGEDKSDHHDGEDKNDHHEEADNVSYPISVTERTGGEEKSFVEDDGPISDLFRKLSSADPGGANPKLPPALEPYKTNKEGLHGYALIINNIRIDGREERLGAKADGENLSKVIKQLRYRLWGGTVHENCTAHRITELAKAAVNADHTPHDSFICCFLSHGDSELIYGTDDKKVCLEDIRKLVINCKSLIGKPKIFFVQACRGGQLPGAHNVQVDDHGETGRVLLPEASDVFFGYATSPHTKACRFTDTGSWYIIELCKALKTYYNKCDLLTIVQSAHYEVCTNKDYVYERREQGVTKYYRQSPQMVSTLIRHFNFY